MIINLTNKNIAADDVYILLYKSLLTNMYLIVFLCVVFFRMLFFFRCSMLLMYMLSTLYIRRFSFATDIARGMAYIHSFKICHGHLKSSNCVVDDRWTVKIAGGWWDVPLKLTLSPVDDARVHVVYTQWNSITPKRRTKKRIRVTSRSFLKRETYG